MPEQAGGVLPLLIVVNERESALLNSFRRWPVRIPDIDQLELAKLFIRKSQKKLINILKKRVGLLNL
jgi:hypothetical protein